MQTLIKKPSGFAISSNGGNLVHRRISQSLSLLRNNGFGGLIGLRSAIIL